MVDKAKSQVINEENKVYSDKDILCGSDEDAIKDLLSSYIAEAEDFWEYNVSNKFGFYKEVYDAIIPDDYPLTVKYFIPQSRRIIDTLTNKLFSALYGEKPYWGFTKIAKSEKDRIEAKIINALLEENLYDFNDFYPDKEETLRSSLIYGLGVEKDSWDYFERELNKTEKVKEVKLKDKKKKDEEENSNFDVETEIQADIEIVKDANCIENVSVWDIRLDPSAVKPDCDHSRFIIQRHYMTFDDLLVRFDNVQELWEQDSYLRTKKDKQGNGYSFRGNADYETEDDVNDNRQEREEKLILVREIYTSSGHCFWSIGDETVYYLLKPKGTTEKTKFLNPYNHGEFPYMVFYNQFDPNNLYGRGLMEQLAPLNLASNDFFNLSIESNLMSLKTPTGINPRYISPSDFQDAMNTPDGLFVLQDDIANIHNAIVRPELRYDSNKMFASYKELDQQMQLQSAVTNFMTGGVQTGQYTQTLGGINQIQAESLQRMSHSIRSNQNGLKKQLLRMISNIFQFQKKETAFVVTHKARGNYIKLKRYLDNNNPSDVWMYENGQLYTLDELAKLKYMFDINWGVGRGNMKYRLQELDTALRYAMQLAPLGEIDVKPIIKELFEKLNVEGVVESNPREDSEQIQYENEIFRSKTDDLNQMIDMGSIDASQYQYMLENSVPPAVWSQNHQLHIANHPPEMTAHIATHEYFLGQLQAISNQLQATAQQGEPIPGNMGQVDARTMVSSATPADAAATPNTTSGGNVNVR